jgi:hypothetical protein
VKVSKRTVAREWLIFLQLFAVGGFVCYAYCYSGSSRYYNAFDRFWNDGFGFHRMHGLYHDWFPAFVWFVPYLGLTLVRSVWWSIKTLAAPRIRSGHD